MEILWTYIIPWTNTRPVGVILLSCSYQSGWAPTSWRGSPCDSHTAVGWQPGRTGGPAPARGGWPARAGGQSPACCQSVCKQETSQNLTTRALLSSSQANKTFSSSFRFTLHPCIWVATIIIIIIQQRSHTEFSLGRKFIFFWCSVKGSHLTVWRWTSWVKVFAAMYWISFLCRLICWRLARNDEEDSFFILFLDTSIVIRLKPSWNVDIEKYWIYSDI